jgi:hypothetical protein
MGADYRVLSRLERGRLHGIISCGEEPLPGVISCGVGNRSYHLTLKKYCHASLVY